MQTNNLKMRSRNLLQNPFTYVFVLTSIGISRGSVSRFLGQNGDAAGYVDILSPGYSNLNLGSGHTIKKLRELTSINPTDLNTSSFLNPHQDFFFLHLHSYIFPSIFRIIPNFSLPIYFPPLMLLAISYALGVTILLKRIIRGDLNFQAKCFLGVLIMSSPILTEAISGQPYIDKIFFGPCIALIFTILDGDLSRRKNRIYLISLLIICITLSERAALFSSILTIYLLVNRFGSNFQKYRENIGSIAVAILGLIWFLIWTKYISDNPDMANLSIENYWSNFQAAINGSRRQSFTLFLINITPFLVLCFMRITLIPIFTIAILPNVIVSIGGAELTGYSTHYHSIYLPIIFALAIFSVTNKNRINQSQSRHKVVFIAAVALLVSLTYSATGIFNLYNLSARTNQIGKQAFESFGLIPKDVMQVRSSSQSEFDTILTDLKLNDDSEISAPEPFMPAIVSDGLRKIEYFPVGVGASDVVVVPFTDSSFEVVEVSIYGLVPVESRPVFSQQIKEILAKSYVKVWQGSGNFGYITIYAKL